MAMMVIRRGNYHILYGCQAIPYHMLCLGHETNQRHPQKHQGPRLMSLLIPLLGRLNVERAFE